MTTSCETEQHERQFEENRILAIAVKSLLARIAELEALVSDLKHAEKALQESEERYRSLVESTDDSIYVVDREYRYLFMNTKHIARMGFTAGEYIGHPYRESHSSEETADFVVQVDRVFSTGLPAYHEHRSMRDGKYFLRTFSPIKSAGGDTVAVSVVSKNISPQKRMEFEREALIADLQDALSKIRTLKGLIPICAWCKKVRSDEGYWSDLEAYVREHSEADFTHGICSECMKKVEEETDGGGKQ